MKISKKKKGNNLLGFLSSFTLALFILLTLESSHCTKVSSSDDEKAESSSSCNSSITRIHYDYVDRKKHFSRNDISTPESFINILAEKMNVIQDQDGQSLTDVIVATDYLKDLSKVMKGHPKEKEIKDTILRTYKKILERLYQAAEREEDFTNGDSAGLEHFSDYEDMSSLALIGEVSLNLASFYMDGDLFEKAKNVLLNAISVFQDRNKNHSGLLFLYDMLAYVSLPLNEFDLAIQSLKKVLTWGEESERLKLFDSHLVLSGESNPISAITRILYSSSDRSKYDSYFEETEGAWDWLKEYIDQRLPSVEYQFHEQVDVDSLIKKDLSKKLATFHQSLFHYYDTLNDPSVREQAFNYLLSSANYNKYDSQAYDQFEVEDKLYHILEHSETLLTQNEGYGVKRRTPIFIIGYPRSGSSLVEKILDAHPLVAGLGERSIFSMNQDLFNNMIKDVEDSGLELGKEGLMRQKTKELGLQYIDMMYDRYNVIHDPNNEKNDLGNAKKKKRPLRLVDKYLANFWAIIQIQMIFPNALILHVMREPMDCLFSAFKHHFGGTSLKFMSDLKDLTHNYKIYREVIDHWEEVLPGRITHLRYEDLVTDPENSIRALIKATGLPWDDEVLNYDKKKYVINTMSSTQINKKIYSNHLNAWKKYEEQLSPVVEMLGDRVELNFDTTLPGYKKLEPNDS